MRTDSTAEYTLLTELYPRIAPEVPGAPSIMMDAAILEVLVDFCKRTGAWRYILDRISLVSEQENYTIDEWPEEARLLKVERVTKYDVDADQTDYVGTNYNLDCVKLDVDRKVVTLLVVPQEDTSNALEIEVSLVPGREITEVPTEFFEEYYQTLAKGIKANLLFMAGKKWSNPQRATQLEIEYRRERGTVIEEVKSTQYDGIGRIDRGIL
jgi:hypothetical protein